VYHNDSTRTRTSGIVYYFGNEILECDICIQILLRDTTAFATPSCHDDTLFAILIGQWVQ
jgi:hypothetical protein